jgi:LmbE family N-acetylglucosaminyl deacetylase
MKALRWFEPRLTSHLFVLLLLAVCLETMPAGAQQPRAEFLALIASGKTVMWVGAHPDDEIISAPLLACAADHTKVIVVSLTSGNAGENKLGGPENCAALGEIRTKELAASCKVLGVEMRVFDFLDVRFSESNEAVVARWKQSGKDPEGELVKVIRAWKPDIIITFDPDRARGHTEHRAAGFLATAAFRDAADPAKFPGQLNATMKTWQAQRLYYSGFRTGGAEDKRPLEVIAFGERSLKRGKTYAEIAAEARAQHATQFGRAPQPSPAARGDPSA